MRVPAPPDHGPMVNVAAPGAPRVVPDVNPRIVPVACRDVDRNVKLGPPVVADGASYRHDPHRSTPCRSPVGCPPVAVTGGPLTGPWIPVGVPAGMRLRVGSRPRINSSRHRRAYWNGVRRSRSQGDAGDEGVSRSLIGQADRDPVEEAPGPRLPPCRDVERGLGGCRGNRPGGQGQHQPDSHCQGGGGTPVEAGTTHDRGSRLGGSGDRHSKCICRRDARVSPVTARGVDRGARLRRRRRSGEGDSPARFSHDCAHDAASTSESSPGGEPKCPPEGTQGGDTGWCRPTGADPGPSRRRRRGTRCGCPKDSEGENESDLKRPTARRADRAESWFLRSSRPLGLGTLFSARGSYSPGFAFPISGTHLS